jgi:hypothetical protein
MFTIHTHTYTNMLDLFVPAGFLSIVFVSNLRKKSSQCSVRMSACSVLFNEDVSFCGVGE